VRHRRSDPLPQRIRYFGGDGFWRVVERLDPQDDRADIVPGSGARWEGDGGQAGRKDKEWQPG